MSKSVLSLSLFVFSLAMVTVVAVLPQPSVEPVAENRSAVEVIADTASKQR
ncbi:MAG: hypothetical protein WDZ84_05835 [Rhodovibrionaceae bacterium]